MIAGIIILFVAVWMYQAAIQAKTGNAFLWVAIGCATFFVTQLLMVNFNVYLLEIIKDSPSGQGVDVDFSGEQVTHDSRGGFSGFFLSVFLELFPVFIGVLAAGFVRTLFVLKIKPTPGNLFGGIKDMLAGIFNGIKGSFKSME